MSIQDYNVPDNAPVFTIAPQGSTFSKEFEESVAVADLSDQDFIDALASMKAAHADTVFLVPTTFAIFISNHIRDIQIKVRVCRPADADSDHYSAAWVGLERFNDMITEQEWIAKNKPADEPIDATRPYSAQYLRLDKDGNPKKLLHPAYQKRMEDSRNDDPIDDGDEGDDA